MKVTVTSMCLNALHSHISSLLKGKCDEYQSTKLHVFFKLYKEAYSPSHRARNIHFILVIVDKNKMKLWQSIKPKMYNSLITH